RVRVVAQLIDAKTDEHLWADTYDRDLEDVFRVQTDVAENIAHALRAELTTEERDRVRRIPTEDLEAYDLFVRAVSACQGMLPEDLATAVEYCQEAIRLDPDFAQAYAMLAQCHVLSGFYANQRPSDLFPKVREAASRALELDPQCGEAHTAMAVFKIQYERDSEGIEEELARALELNPDDSFAYFWKATYLLCRGHFAEAEGVMRQGLVSDPLSPLGHHDLGQVLAFGGRADEAIQVLESAVRHWPDLSLLHLWLGISHLYVNEPESALPHFETAVELSGPLPFFDSTRGIGLAAVGRVAEAREVLEDLEARSRSEYVDPFNLFNLTASLDGFDAAAPHLDEALEARSFFLPYLGVIPRYRPLHSEPRFRAVLNTVWPGVSFEV
ncbi:MAG: tetratricopeptide repeat protein, partial [Gemmatimonadetes bacterium]|nr:tetratricopeptide repeat protein [Gemmatimonadota bacterium]